MEADSTIAWLMDGDPAIRWQTMRDLLGRSEEEWQSERQKISQEGWGLQFESALLPDDRWPVGRWTGTVWSLVQLVELGYPCQEGRVRSAATKFLDELLTEERACSNKWLLKEMDQCHLAFWLRIGAHFGYEPERLQRLAKTLLNIQFADGGWNCRVRMKPATSHSSFHTTFNVLDGLRQAARSGLIEAERFREAESRALEFMLQHQMYRSDKTGEIVQERFTYLSYPSHWHYTVLRGLDYMSFCPEIGDPRLADPIALVEARRKANGRWPVEHRIAGDTLFDMEKMGGDSRWNTLRALRVLSARQNSASPIRRSI